jgi:hypothetical protein
VVVGIVDDGFGFRHRFIQRYASSGKHVVIFCGSWLAESAGRSETEKHKRVPK